MDPVNSLLQKYLSGRGNPEEIQQAELWIKEYPKEYNHIKKFWNATAMFSYQDVDVASAMMTLESKLETDTRKSPKKIQVVVRRSVAAAAIVLVLGSSLIFMQKQVRQELITLKDQELVQDLELSDGSHVEVNKGSVLIYPKSFSKKYRKVELQSGNAFFEISKNPDKPFIIQTPQGQVKVLGTAFNVFVSQEKTEVFVQSGKVKLIKEKNKKTIVLSQKACGYIGDVDVVMAQSVSINYLSWRTNHLEFINAGLKELMQSLERHFQCSVRFEHEDYPDIQFNGKFTDPQLVDIMEVIELTCHLDYEILDQEIILTQAR